MKVTKAQIDTFLESKRIAVVGVSRNEKKMGHYIFKDLRKLGFDILPINPKANEILGVKCYASIDDLPVDIDRVLIATPKTNTDDVLVKAIEKGIPHIWVQRAANSPKTIEIAKQNNKEIIHSQCIFMFADPTGIHKFHRFLNKIVGLYPN